MTEYPSDYRENFQVALWRENEIVCSYFKKGLIINLNTAKQLVAFRKDNYPDTYPLLNMIQDIDYLTPDASQYLAGEEAFDGITKMALIVKSEFKKLLGNIYISTNKPIRPTKLFTKKEEGIKWLRK